MSVAQIVGLRSQCSRAQVGCVIVDQDQQVLAASYNGPPPGTNNEGPCKMWCMRAMTQTVSTDYSNCPSSHAEINALVRMPPTTKNTTLYVNRMCCYSCAKAIASAKIGRVVFLETDIDEHLGTNETVKYLENAGILIESFHAASLRDSSILRK